MSEHCTLWLPFPPSVNNLFAHANVGGKVRRFPSRHYKQWSHAAIVLIKSARLPKILTGAVAVRLTLTPPCSRRRDVDNYVKPVLDVLVKAGVLGDDSQVQAMLAKWDHDAAEPGAIVEFGAVTAERPSLSRAERGALDRLRRAGNRLVSSPSNSMSAVHKRLIKKGYAEPIQGLFDDTPQGVRPTD